MRGMLVAALGFAAMALPNEAHATNFSEVARVVGEVCLERSGNVESVRAWAAQNHWAPLSSGQRTRLSQLDTMTLEIGLHGWISPEGGPALSVTLDDSGHCQVHYDGIAPQPFRELYALTVDGHAFGEEDEGVPVQFSRVIAVRWLPQNHQGWGITNFMDLRTRQRGAVFVTRPAR